MDHTASHFRTQYLHSHRRGLAVPKIDTRLRKTSAVGRNIQNNYFYFPTLNLYCGHWIKIFFPHWNLSLNTCQFCLKSFLLMHKTMALVYVIRKSNRITFIISTKRAYGHEFTTQHHMEEVPNECINKLNYVFLSTWCVQLHRFTCLVCISVCNLFSKIWSFFLTDLNICINIVQNLTPCIL